MQMKIISRQQLDHDKKTSQWLHEKNVCLNSTESTLFGRRKFDFAKRVRKWKYCSITKQTNNQVSAVIGVHAGPATWRRQNEVIKSTKWLNMVGHFSRSEYKNFTDSKIFRLISTQSSVLYDWTMPEAKNQTGQYQFLNQHREPFQSCAQRHGVAAESVYAPSPIQQRYILYDNWQQQMYST